jgi:Tol biopolymer transport system component
VLDLLVYLAAAGGRVVSRSELLEEVWGDVVVNEEAVSRAVSELRKALGDDPREPRYVQTIHKSGYRLLAPVSTTAQSLSAGTQARSSRIEATSEPPAVWWRRPALLGVASVVLAVAAVFWWRAESRRESVESAPSAPLAAQLLTAYPGREIDPAVDRPGERVVFAWNREPGDSDEYDLYVRRFGPNAEPTQITNTPGFEGHPAWSPDGGLVAFVREGQKSVGVWVVPGLGGEERLLVELEEWSYGLDWFPDGRSVVVSQPRDNGVNRLVRLSLDAPGARELTTPEARVVGDFRPAVSPDGRWVAFVRASQLGHQEVYVVSTGDGEERRLSRSGGRIRGVDWSPDGRAVIYSSDLGGGFGLWRTAIDSREPEWLPLNGQNIYNPVVAATGRLVFESISFQKNLWRLDLIADPEGVDATRLAVHSTRQETSPAVSPDGLKLAFVSNRTGQRSLWLSAIDGSASRPLTRSDEVVAADPVWSPEGSRIAVGLVMSGYARPVVVEVESGRTRSLLEQPAHAIPVAWSHDGQRIYLASDRSGQWDLWSIGADGHLPWRMVRGSIYSVVFADEEFRLARLDPATGAVEQIARPPGLHDGIFSLSPDAKQLIYSRVEESESDLMFIDGALGGE